MVLSLEYRMNALAYETDNFTWDYTSASNMDVVNVFLVAKSTIDGLSSIMMKIIAPKHRMELRKRIAYLVGLRHRQAEAWEWYIKDCEQRSKNTDKWVQQNKR